MATKVRRPKPTTMPKLIDHRRLAERMGCCTKTIRRRVAAGTFPRPLPCSDSILYWEEEPMIRFIKTGEWAE